MEREFAKFREEQGFDHQKIDEEKRKFFSDFERRVANFQDEQARYYELLEREFTNFSLAYFYSIRWDTQYYLNKLKESFGSEEFTFLSERYKEFRFSSTKKIDDDTLYWIAVGKINLLEESKFSEFPKDLYDFLVVDALISYFACQAALPDMSKGFIVLSEQYWVESNPIFIKIIPTIRKTVVLDINGFKVHANDMFTKGQYDILRHFRQLKRQ